MGREWEGRGKGGILIDCFSKQSTSYHDVDDIMVTLPRKWGGNGRGLEEGYVPDPPNIPPREYSSEEGGLLFLLFSNLFINQLK